MSSGLKSTPSSCSVVKPWNGPWPQGLLKARLIIFGLGLMSSGPVNNTAQLTWQCQSQYMSECTFVHPQSFSDLNEIWHVVEVDDCYTTVCHMTPSKVKVTEV